MNKERREEIKKNISLLENAKSNLDSILSDEEFAFDNMQNFQNSLRGMDSENAISILSEVVDSIETCIDSLNEIV